MRLREADIFPSIKGKMLRLGTKPQGIWCVKLSRTNKDLAL